MDNIKPALEVLERTVDNQKLIVDRLLQIEHRLAKLEALLAIEVSK